MIKKRLHAFDYKDFFNFGKLIIKEHMQVLCILIRNYIAKKNVRLFTFYALH